MSDEITRRTFIGTAAVIVLAPVADAASEQAATSRRTLRAAIDRIIPAQGKMPAASSVGAVEYLEALSARDQEFSSGSRKHSRRWARRSAESAENEQISALEKLEKTDPPAFGALRDVVYEAYYTNPKIWALDRVPFRTGQQEDGCRSRSSIRNCSLGFSNCRGCTARRTDAAGARRRRGDRVRRWQARRSRGGSPVAGVRVVCLEQGDWHRPSSSRRSGHEFRSLSCGGATTASSPATRHRPEDYPIVTAGAGRRHGHVEWRRRQHGALGGAFPAFPPIRFPRSSSRWRRRRLADRFSAISSRSTT